MHDDNAAAIELPSKARSRAVTRPYVVRGLNMGSVAGRRYRDRCLALESELRRQGVAITPTLQAKIARAARLAIIAAQMGERALRGESVDTDALIRSEGTAERAERALGIKPGSPNSEPDLAAYLASLSQTDAITSSSLNGTGSVLDESTDAAALSPSSDADKPAGDHGSRSGSVPL